MKCHAHGKDTGSDPTIIRYLVADDSTGSGIHDKPDIGLDPSDFDISFISGEDLASLVGIWVNKGLDADGASLTVISYLLMGNVDDI